MKAEEAKKLAIANKPLASEINIKKSEKELRNVYSMIANRANHGHDFLKWDYRDSHDRVHIKQKLIENGYSISEAQYPYLLIKW